jgi:endonuclease G
MIMIATSDVIAKTLLRTKDLRGRLVRLTKIRDDTERARPVTVEQKHARLGGLVAETGSLREARGMLERMIGGNDLSPINYLARGTAASRAVCRVHLRDESGQTVGFGTGFLIAPGVLMTNHHVIATTADATTAVAEFDYELDLQGRDRIVTEFALVTDPLPISVEALDFCIVAVAARSRDGQRALNEYGWLPLDPRPGKAFVGEYLTIIQHPGGERKQVCVRENKLLKYDESGSTLWYQTDTVAGSSGSPVFNNSWQVVALHHSGIPQTDAQGRWLTTDGQLWDDSMGENRVAWIANEGIRVSQIVEHLRTQHGDQLLAQRVLHAEPAPVPNEVVRHLGSGNGAGHLDNGALHIPLPAEIVVRLSGLEQLGLQAGDTPPLVPVSLSSISPRGSKAGNGAAKPTNGKSLHLGTYPSGIEAVSVDQSNYPARTGYDSQFLGDGALKIPLPKTVGPASSVLTFKQGSKITSVLNYWNYSVVMHRVRHLALFSAVNVDAGLRPNGAGRDGDRWYTDKRIPAANQIGAEFYGAQTKFELDRTRNPFDRGHLSRRLDVQWGEAAATAKRNGDDSFHWTNCSPQHWQFNQGKKRWLGLEDYVIATFAHDTGRACVVNGPVFDAPLSMRGPDGRVAPQLQGKQHKDPTFGSVSIPKLFFKIVATRGASGNLVAAAFLMSQEDFLLGVDRLKGMPASPQEILSTAEARLYQVTVEDIERLTNLDFGVLKAADSIAAEVSQRSPRLITDASQIRMAPRSARSLWAS